jgi:hypothetical protein
MDADGNLLIVLVMGSGAFDTEDLGSARAAVPVGTTVVMYIYLEF